MTQGNGDMTAMMSHVYITAVISQATYAAICYYECCVCAYA